MRTTFAIGMISTLLPFSYVFAAGGPLGQDTGAFSGMRGCEKMNRD